jgi:hypothetical protein
VQRSRKAKIMAMSKRLKAELLKQEAELDKTHPMPSRPPWHGLATEKETLKAIEKLSNEITDRPWACNTPCSQNEVMELSQLTYFFGYMEIDRKMMLHHFERHQKLKQEAKKREDWTHALRYVRKLGGLASQSLSRDFRD